jgi:hypothetical protein
MMANLWDYLTNAAKSMPVGAEGIAKLATEPGRFAANGVTSVYDSFKRGMQPTAFGEDPYLKRQQNVEDAFNVAGAAMVGGMPGVPKGNSPSTLGMAFRRPQDVVYTADHNPTSHNLKEAFGENYDLYNLISRYHNKDWGTVNDPVIQHIDKGFKVPSIPGLNAADLNAHLKDAKLLDGTELQENIRGLKQDISEYEGMLSAETDFGKYVEGSRDLHTLYSAAAPSNAAFRAQGMPQKTKDYLLNTEDVSAFARPSLIDLVAQRLPYKIEGNLNRMSLADMLMQATEKEAALAKAPTEKLHEFDDGHYWTQLKTQAQRDAESDAMGNSTRLPMHDGKDLYSLRDKNGKSILTASRIPDGLWFDEIKTRFNDRNIQAELARLTPRKKAEHEYYSYVQEIARKLGMIK